MCAKELVGESQLDNGLLGFHRILLREALLEELVKALRTDSTGYIVCLLFWLL